MTDRVEDRLLRKIDGMLKLRYISGTRKAAERDKMELDAWRAFGDGELRTYLEIRKGTDDVVALLMRGK